MEVSKLKTCFEKFLKSIFRISVRTTLLFCLVVNYLVQTELSQVFYEHYSYSGYYSYTYVVLSSTIFTYPLYLLFKLLLYGSNQCFSQCFKKKKVKKNEEGTGNENDSSKIKYMNRHRIGRIFLGSLFLTPLMGVNSYLYLSALDLVQVSVVQTMQQISSIFVVLFALMICLREERRFLCIKSMLIFVSLLGVSLISIFSTTQKTERFPNAWLGVLFLVVQTLFLSLYQVLYVKYFEDLNVEEVFLYLSFSGIVYMIFFWYPIFVFSIIGFESFQISIPIIIFNVIMGVLAIAFGVNLTLILTHVKAPIYANLGAQLSTVGAVIVDSIVRKNVTLQPMVGLGIFVVLLASFFMNLVYMFPDRWNCRFGKKIFRRNEDNEEPELDGFVEDKEEEEESPSTIMTIELVEN